MLNVEIKINETQLRSLVAMRVKGKMHEVCTYEIVDVTNGKYKHIGKISHNYDDGAEKLVCMMLKLSGQSELPTTAPKDIAKYMKNFKEQGRGWI